MKISNYLIYCLSIFLFAMPACTKVNGKGPVVTEIRTVEEFYKIDFKTNGRLFYRQSPVHRVEIQAQKNILDVIEAYVKNGELFLEIKNNTVIHSYEPISILVESPDIYGVKVDGSGDLFANESITTDRFYTDIQGSGKIDLNRLVTRDLSCDIHGSGNILIRNGEAEKGELDISGSGDINLVNLPIKQLDTKTHGSGNMEVWVTDFLYAEINGSGHVRYKGNPQVSVKISGSGRVSPW